MYSAPLSILFILLLILSSCTENEENTTSEELNIDTTLVGKHGRLEVKGNQIVDKHGNPMSLAGNSFFGAMIIGVVSATTKERLFHG